MDAFEALSGIAGESHELMGTNVLYEPETQSPLPSTAHGRLRRVVGGRMLRFDYRWAYRSEAHEGTLLLARDTDGRVTAAWGDSWHQNRELMSLSGESNDGAVALRGTWTVGDSPPWGWRIDLGPSEDGGVTMEMWVVTPDGEEARAVEMVLSR
ncbi:MAG TPA: DUF1579 family protein [Trueperaceae bacterium]|nr:DUF1579 family protein [Trueperaceae bacterium]